MDYGILCAQWYRPRWICVKGSKKWDRPYYVCVCVCAFLNRIPLRARYRFNQCTLTVFSFLRNNKNWTARSEKNGAQCTQFWVSIIFPVRHFIRFRSVTKVCAHERILDNEESETHWDFQWKKSPFACSCQSYRARQILTGMLERKLCAISYPAKLPYNWREHIFAMFVSNTHATQISSLMFSIGLDSLCARTRSEARP